MFFSPRPTSPLLVHNSLPSPPPLGPRRVSSRSRLHLPSNLNDPPIPPRLIGSPLLDKLTAPESGALTSNIQKQLWFDGDEFGTRAAATASQSRSRSPPPPSLLMVSIPPVPPIPSSAFNSPGAKRSVLRTPPATPRSRAMQIVIPDLDDPAPETRADRRARRASRTYPVTSPRRRTAGPEAH
ncbi:uncharacterized protein BXZ73DRAFT_97552 [Epithele typhae]|uniref:uncharacterized protein n=1 Tax=Epithele typhae TaxID=378194 RepID=UPI0020085F04|nr:uncharacterized protein BXZ73DRAFT_97552 [Epithele typhae]KAH9943512.1 hypothetical protein BXZ73DRAFT_97552 [Epithele typhae]